MCVCVYVGACVSARICVCICVCEWAREWPCVCVCVCVCVCELCLNKGTSLFWAPEDKMILSQCQCPTCTHTLDSIGTQMATVNYPPASASAMKGHKAQRHN